MAAALLVSSGCGGVECADGTTERDGECVVSANGCGEGTQLVDGACVPADTSCDEGTQFDEEAGRCVPAEGSCSDGTTYDMGTGRCVADTSVVCGDGTAADDTNICVPSDEACGAMTSLDDNGRCVVEAAVCGDGSELDPNNNTCVLVDEACGPNLALDSETGQCVATADVCTDPGTAFDEESGLCLPDACDEGDVLVNGVCLSPAEELAQNADITETENNDPALGGTAESLTIPSVGDDPTSFTGTIGEPSDLDGDSAVDQDLDVYSFSGSAGMWLNVGVQTTGAPAPGFRIEGPNGFVRWSAIGLQANPARQVVLPYDGDYTLTVIPQVVLDNMDVGPIGGDDWGYVGTVEQIAAPSPTSVDITANTASGSLAQLSDNFYELTGFSGGELLTINADTVGDDGEAVVTLWEDATTFIGAKTVTEGDTVDAVVPGSGNLFVLVDWRKASGPSLDFELSGSVDDTVESLGTIAADSTVDAPAIALADGDTQTYTFSVPAGQVIEIYHNNDEDEDIDLLLFDALGNELLDSSFVDDIDDSLPDYNYWYTENGGTFVLEIEATTDLTNEVVTIETHTPNDLGSVAVGDTVNQTISDGLIEERSEFHIITPSGDIELEGSVTSTPAETVDGWLYDASFTELDALISGDPLDLNGTVIPAGKHLLRVEATGGDFTDYTIDFTAVEPPQREVEPNDTDATATPVTLDRDIKGTSADDTDVDVYSFSPTADLAANEVLVIRMDQDGVGSDEYRCALRDSSGNVIYDNGPDGREDGCNVYGTGLVSSETYFFEIERAAFSDSEDYTIMTEIRTGVLEAEPNEDETQATNFSYTDLTGGNFALFGDVLLDTDTDYFSFTLASDRPGAEIVAFSQLDPAPHPNNTSTVDWRLLDGSLNELASGDWDQPLEASGLTAGTYYLEITRSSSTEDLAGAYEISASTRTAVCGDGVVEGNETCEDGNTTAGDGCDASCSLEGGAVELKSAAGESVSVAGALEVSDPTFNRVTSSCSFLGFFGMSAYFDQYEFTNNTGASVTVDITASWSFDGYLNIFSSGFDSTDPEATCLDADDDFNGTSGSQVTGLTVADGETIVVVGTSFLDGSTGPYSIEVATQ
jgi:cysteine-rich repeat protein